MSTLLDVQGRRTVGYLTNKSGGAVAYGDVVILDSANNEAFTTSTAGAEVVGVGVVTEVNGIANNAAGRIAFQGYVDLVNVNASVTRGHFGKTYTVAKQATDAGASRVLGVFCQFLTGGTTPTAMLFGQPDGVTGAGGLSGGTPALTFSTSNAAGSASSGIRTDATIALFDATVPVTQAFDDAAAAGSAGVAARRDHKHAMPAAAALPGHEFSYVEHTSDVNVTATVEASADTIVTAAAFAGDGSTTILIEYYCGDAEASGGTVGRSLVVWLFDGSTSLGYMGLVVGPTNTSDRRPFYGARRLTPSNASHTYSARGTVSAGTGILHSGSGGTGVALPAFIRITKI
jgi:hypothetical protein